MHISNFHLLQILHLIFDQLCNYFITLIKATCEIKILIWILIVPPTKIWNRWGRIFSSYVIAQDSSRYLNTCLQNLYIELFFMSLSTNCCLKKTYHTCYCWTRIQQHHYQGIIRSLTYSLQQLVYNNYSKIIILVPGLAFDFSSRQINNQSNNLLFPVIN